MKHLKPFFLTLILTFSLAATVTSTARANPLLLAVPAVEYIAGQTLRTVGASVVADVVARGFAANDPRYYRTTATIPKSTFARNLFNSKLFWGAAIAAGLLLPSTDSGQQIQYDADLDRLVVKSYGNNIKRYNLHCNWTDPCGKIQSSTPPYAFYYYGAHYSHTEIKVCSEGGVTYDNCVYTYYKTKHGSEFNPPLSDALARYSVEFGIPQTHPLTESEIEKYILPELLNPAFDFSQAARDADLNELFKDAEVAKPDAVAVPQELADLLPLFKEGLLQSTNPDAEHYVTPEVMRQLQELANAQADAADNVISEKELDALNQQLEQPITQAQYEQSNKVFAVQADAGIKASTAAGDGFGSDVIKSVGDTYDDIHEQLNTPLELPDFNMGAVTDFLPRHTSNCLTIGGSALGHDFVFPNADQCAKLQNVKSGIGYIMWWITAFAICLALLRRSN